MLRTARVLVLDDNPLEALPILIALGRSGIGCVYLRGNKLEELPPFPLSGMRVAFVDMDLDVGGDDKAKVSTLIAVLGKLFGSEPCPLVLVLWTKHPDLLELFRKDLAANLPNIRPTLLIPMAKPFNYEGKEWHWEEDDKRSYKDMISSLILKSEPLEVLWSWEQGAHDAASNTTSELGRIVSSRAPDRDLTSDPDDSQWLESLATVLCELMAAAGPWPDDVLQGQYGLLDSLSRVHFDRLQRQIGETPSAAMKGLVARGRPMSREGDNASLNSMLLTDHLIAGDKTIRPGNIYLKAGGAPIKGSPFTHISVSHARVTQDLLANDGTINGAARKSKACEEKGDDEGAEVARSEISQRVSELCTTCPLVLLELTPACDFAHGKQRTARFLTGIVVPARLHRALVKPMPEYVIGIGPLVIGDSTDPREIVFDLRYFFGLEDPASAITEAPSLRLRHHVLVHIQSKVAAHVARPGYMSLE